jgi:hypothetical protein
MKRRISASLVLLMGLLMGVGDRAAYGAEANVLERIYRSLFGGQEPPVPSSAGGSRPLEKDKVCIVSPGRWSRDDVVLWQLRPLLVWRGAVKRVSLRVEGASSVLWQQAIVGGEVGDRVSQVFYTGPSLQPGQTYQWEFTRADDTQLVSLVRVMDASVRSSTTQDWLTIQNRAWVAGERGEALVQKRIQFLTEQKLWLDIVHEVFRSGNQSVGWQQLQQGIVEETCDRVSKR